MRKVVSATIDGDDLRVYFKTAKSSRGVTIAISQLFDNKTPADLLEDLMNDKKAVYKTIEDKMNNYQPK